MAVIVLRPVSLHLGPFERDYHTREIVLSFKATKQCTRLCIIYIFKKNIQCRRIGQLLRCDSFVQASSGALLGGLKTTAYIWAERRRLPDTWTTGATED